MSPRTARDATVYCPAGPHAFGCRRSESPHRSSSEVNTTVCLEDIMASSEKFNDDQGSLSSGLTRRQFLPLLGATAIAAAAPGILRAAPGGVPGKPSDASARFVYVGTYTAPDMPPGGTHPSTAVGIYVFKMDASDGNLTPVQTVVASNPSYLALDSSLTHLYSVNEDLAGRVSAYAISADGTLTLLNSADANGSFTTHVGVHPSGKFVYAANYGTGNYPVYPINADGSIGAKSDDFQGVGNGAGPNPQRQEGPHAHQMIADWSGNHV